MKEGVLLLALVASAGGAWWYFRPFPGMRSVTAGAPEATTAAPEKPSPKGKKEQEHSRVKKSRITVEMSAVEVPYTPPPEPAPTAETASQSDRTVERALPPVTDLKRGLSRTDLDARLGTPTLIASTVDRGSLFETYIYHGKGRSAIVAYLQDGRLQKAVAER